jgi:hypothetical protein
MLQDANSSVSEDEPMEYTTHSSVTHNAATALDTIIHSINKRYEVYQKRRTAMTPFSTPPAEALPGGPPTPRPILGDSSMANASSVGGSGGSATASRHSTSQPVPDPLATSIVVANAHPAPYWEERELYIVAEDLCCHLNGGINYRLMCEQYQRAFEVLLTLVKEDVALCASGAVELVPGGTTRVMGKLQALLKESRRMLEAAGVDVPPRLSSILEELPTSPEEHPFVESPPAPRHATPSLPGGASNSMSLNPGVGGPGGAHARPPSAPTPTRRQNSANGANDPHMSHDVPPRVPSASGGAGGGPSRGRPLPSRSRSGISTPDTAHLPVHFSFSGNGVGGPGGGGGGSAGTGARRNTPSSAVIVDPPADVQQGLLPTDTVNGMGDAAGAHERHGSILRNSAAGNGVSLPSSTTPSPLSNAVASKTKPDPTMATTTRLPAYLARPPSGEPPQPVAAGGTGHGLRPVSGKEKEKAKGVFLKEAAAAVNEKAAPRVEDSAVVGKCVSPTPRSPPRQLCGDLSGDDHPSSSTPAERNDDGGAAEPVHDLRGRLRLLEELYGEHYAMDGMTLLTDALGVVFTREYDQGAEPQYQNGFTALQRDVNNKVMPALKSYDAFQLRINELTPLRSAYLASCLARHVRPHDTVLEQLKRIDHDRTPEALLLGGLHLGDLGTAAVLESVVPRLYRLRTLDLSGNNVHNPVLDMLFRSLRYHPALETVNLSRNPITDDGLTFLLRLAQTVPRLSSILLQSSSMTPQAKQKVEVELTTPGTYAVSTPLPHRPLSRMSTSNIAGMSASAPRASHPPTAHRPPSSLDGRSLWSPKSAARAESMPTKVSSSVRRTMATGGGGAAGETKLPPLKNTAPSQTTLK